MEALYPSDSHKASDMQLVIGSSPLIWVSEYVKRNVIDHYGANRSIHLDH
jgi:hypothetical protein